MLWAGWTLSSWVEGALCEGNRSRKMWYFPSWILQNKFWFQNSVQDLRPTMSVPLLASNPPCFLLSLCLYSCWPSGTHPTNFQGQMERLLTFSSVQFSHSVVSNSAPRGLQHTRPPCPSKTPRVYSNSRPLSWWYHPTISSSVIPFSSCLQSFPASGSFLLSQFFASGGQSIGVSASTSVLPVNIQDWFPLGWTGSISLQSKGLSRVFSINIFLNSIYIC